MCLGDRIYAITYQLTERGGRILRIRSDSNWTVVSGVLEALTYRHGGDDRVVCTVRMCCRIPVRMEDGTLLFCEQVLVLGERDVSPSRSDLVQRLRCWERMQGIRTALSA